MGSHNRNIQKPLEDMAKKALNNKKGASITPDEIFQYFMKVGVDLKGNCQTYNYETGINTEVTVGVDPVALAVACTGVPVPDTGFFVDISGKVRIEKTDNHILAAYVAPQFMQIGKSFLRSVQPITFVAMTGWKWGGGIGGSIEVGVKTPDLPFMEKNPTGGGVDNKTAKVKSGTYAELCAFEAGAKASIKGEAGIDGERLFVKDVSPIFAGSSSGIQKDVLQVLKLGNKKAVMKAGVLDMFYHSRNTEIRKLAPKKGFIKKLITKGNISTETFLKKLYEARALPRVKEDTSALSQIDHHISVLKIHSARKRLGAYCFLSFWSANPKAGVKTEASISASFSMGVGVASGGAGIGAAITGPGVSASYKTSRYRFQVCNLVDIQGGENKLVRTRSYRDLRKAERTSEATPIRQPYSIVTQDTKIVYGQINLNVVGISGSVEIGAKQGLIKDTKYQGSGGEKGGTDKKLGEASYALEAKAGWEETGISGKGQAKLRYKVVNYVYYDSAVAYWTPPQFAGEKDSERQRVTLGPNSGFSFGMSVSLDEIRKHVRSFKSTGKLSSYLQGLANAINVTRKQLKAFLSEKTVKQETISDLILDSKVPDVNAFIFEATFVSKKKSLDVGVMWKNGGWKLGPFKRIGSSSLRELLIPKKPKLGEALQSIRLRYRIEDTSNESRTRFKLGISYIAKLGINIESIERAGSLGVFDMATRWYNHNYKIAQDAYENAVPEMTLFFQ